MSKPAPDHASAKSMPKGIPVLAYTDRLVLIFPNGARVPVITDEVRAARRALRAVMARAARLVSPTPEQAVIRRRQIDDAKLTAELATRRCLDRAGLRVTADGLPELIPDRFAA